jgi:hypothetical protein
MIEWRERKNGKTAEWRTEWSNGGNGGNGENGRMAERQNGRMAEMATYVLFMVHAAKMAGMAGMAPMAGMAERQKEWQNGRIDLTRVSDHMFQGVHLQKCGEVLRYLGSDTSYHFWTSPRSYAQWLFLQQLTRSSIINCHYTRCLADVSDT